VSRELPLAAASRRLRGVPGFPRRAGRPRTRAVDGHESGHVTKGAAQPSAATSENGRDPETRVCTTPVVALERGAGELVTVAPALLSVPDSARYLGVSPRTIEAYVAAGLVAPVRLPSPRGGRYLGRVLLERASLDELVAGARGRR
jgi:hypothetical protein